jgi:hypothetical protein
MPANRIELIGLSVLFLTATATAASAQQNPGTTLLNGMTFNPLPSPSTSSQLLPATPENPVSPALPNTAGGVVTNTTTGTNPLTGLPCSGPGSLSVSGAGGLPGTTAAPVNGSPVPTTGPIQTPAFPSVFGSANTSGAC